MYFCIFEQINAHNDDEPVAVPDGEADARVDGDESDDWHDVDG